MITVNPVSENVADESNVKAIQLLEVSQALVISSQEDYELASKKLSKVKAAWKEIESERKKLSIPVDNAKKAIQTLFKKPLDMLASAERKIKDVLGAYQQEMERIQSEEQARLRIAAEKERQRLLKRAEKAPEAKAEILKQQAESVSAPIVPDKVEKTIGLSFRIQYYAELVNPAEVERQWLMPDVKAVNSFVKSTEGSKPVKGFRILSRRIQSQRG